MAGMKLPPIPARNRDVSARVMLSVFAWRDLLIRSVGMRSASSARKPSCAGFLSVLVLLRDEPWSGNSEPERS